MSKTIMPNQIPDEVVNTLCENSPDNFVKWLLAAAINSWPNVNNNYLAKDNRGAPINAIILPLPQEKIMTDIVERLRMFKTGCDKPECERLVFTSLVCEQAADEIERLRKALKAIASGKFSGITLTSYPPQDPAVNHARAALEKK